MAVSMTLEDLREYLRAMSEDEILQVTFEFREEGEGGNAGSRKASTVSAEGG